MSAKRRKVNDEQEEEKIATLTTPLDPYLDQDTSSIVLQYLLFIPKNTTVFIALESAPHVPSDNGLTTLSVDFIKMGQQTTFQEVCLPAIQDSLRSFYSISDTLATLECNFSDPLTHVCDVTIHFHQEAINFLPVMESLVARLSETRPVTCQVKIGRFTYTIEPSVVHPALIYIGLSGHVLNDFHDKPPAVLLNWLLRVFGTEYEDVMPQFFPKEFFNKLVDLKTTNERKQILSDILSYMDIKDENNINAVFFFDDKVPIIRNMKTLHQALKKHYPLQVLCDSGFTRIMDMYGIV